MSKTKHLLLIAFIGIVGTTQAQNKKIAFEHGNWSEVLEKAKKENKLVYLDCYTTWCGPCKWMEKNVFTNDTVADFYNTHFVNIEMDMEKGEGKELAKKYGIQAYPTMLYVNAQGEVIHRTCGSAPSQQFIQLGNDALNPEKQIAGSAKKFNAGKTDAASALNYFTMLENGCQDSKSELTAYFANQKEEDLISRSNWNIIYNFSNDYSAPEFIYLEKNKEAFSKKYTADSVKRKISSVYINGLTLSIRKKDDKNYELIKSKIQASGNPEAENIILDADMKLYSRDGKWDKYAEAAAQLVEKFAKENANILNSIAWNFYENVSDKKMLEKAESWAKHAVELQDNYAYNDTYAAILYKLGKKEDAKKAASKAIEQAKQSGEAYAETEQLLKKIDKLK